MKCFKNIDHRSSIKKVTDIKNFAKDTEKHVNRSLPLRKNACNLKLQHSCFLVNFEKILKAPFM